MMKMTFHLLKELQSYVGNCGKKLEFGVITVEARDKSHLDGESGTEKSDIGPGWCGSGLSASLQTQKRLPVRFPVRA